MPTYQYACTACHHQLEAVQSFTDDPLRQCPVCDGQLRKLFGSVGIVFKGPGFYRTDSRNGVNGNGNKPSANDANGDSPASKDKPASKEKPASKDKQDSSNGSSGSSGSSGGKEKTEKTAASASATAST